MHKDNLCFLALISLSISKHKYINAVVVMVAATAAAAVVVVTAAVVTGNQWQWYQWGIIVVIHLSFI